jgi:hypothetical protein
MSGFSFRYTLSGAAPSYAYKMLKDGESITEGMLVAASTEGTIAPATSAAGTTDLWGVATGTQAESAGSYVYVITNEDAVYAVSDASARYPGDTLSICSDSLTVCTAVASTSGNLVVVATSASTEETLFRIVPNCHVTHRIYAVDTGSQIA